MPPEKYAPTSRMNVNPEEVYRSFCHLAREIQNANKEDPNLYYQLTKHVNIRKIEDFASQCMKQ